MDSAVLDDVVGVIMMTVLFTYASTGSLDLVNLFFIVVFSILFFVISLTVGFTAMQTISEKIPIEKENLLLGGIIILLSFALITKSIGLVAIIGAFVAGIVTGQTQFSEPLAGSISLIGEGFFIPIFFVHMGMRFNLNAFTSVGFFGVVLIILAIGGKIIGCGIGAKISDFNNRESLATGTAMVPRAEVALIIASFGLGHGIINHNILSTILVMVIVTSIAIPMPLWKLLQGIDKK